MLGRLSKSVLPKAHTVVARAFAASAPGHPSIKVNTADPALQDYYAQVNKLGGVEQFNTTDGLLEKNLLDSSYPDTRAFSYIALNSTKAMYAGLAQAAVCKVVAQMAASADVLALASVEVNISGFAEGTNTTVKWRGKPIFIKHRTPAEIARSKADDSADLRDKEADSARVVDDKWLIVIGICTHLGCVPIPGAGDYPGGFFCPCHGSHYDSSGRIRRGPAPLNLEVPTYKLDGDLLVIG
jgi:ubiquinol-cytochrome c reductase iron-sulfur subunit